MKLFNRNFVLCLLVHFWFMMSFFITTPLIAQFIVELGEATTLAGFVAGIFSLLALVFRPVSGFAADRYYRKFVLAIGYGMCILSFFGYALSTSFVTVLAFRVTHALGMSIQTTLISVVAMDFMPKERMAEGVGWIAIAGSLGMGFGPSAGVGLASIFGLRGAFVASGIVMIITCILVAILPIRKHAPSTKPFSVGAFFSVRALPLGCSAMTFAFCAGLTTSMLVLSGDARGIAGVSGFFLIAAIGMTIVRPISGRIVDRKGLPTVVPAAFIAEALGMTMIALAQSLVPILAAGVFRAFGQGVGQAAMQAQALKEAPAEERGTTNSTFYMGIDIGQGMGAIAGGAIADAFGFSAMFMAGPAALIFGVACYLVWLRRHKTETAA